MQERGSTLLVVLVVGILLAILAATSKLNSDNSTKISGLQRVDFQDLHAAEAGIIFTQNRFNQAVTLCSGYFSSTDSSAVIAAMVDAVYSLPSYYGSARAVKVSNFQLLPGRPMLIGFNSTGGRMNGLFFDTTGGHTLKAKVRMSTLGDYASFVQVGWGSAGAGVVNKGRIHAENVGAYRNVTFEREVTYTNSYKYLDTNPFVGPTPIFKKGQPKRVNGNPFTLDRIYVDDASASTCGARTYKDLASGLVSGEGAGFTYTGATSIYVPLDSIQQSGANVVWKCFAYDSTLFPPKGAAITSPGVFSVPIGQFNGVFYAGSNVYVGGKLTNFSLTLTGGQIIYITDNISCTGNEATNTDNRVTLGLIPKNQIRYWSRCPTSISVEAAFVAPANNWVVDGDTATHVGVDTLGNSCSKSLSSCWYFRRMGGAICRNGSSVGIYGSKTPRLYEFDPDMLFSPPPKFPSLFGQSGAVPVWSVADWGER